MGTSEQIPAEQSSGYAAGRFRELERSTSNWELAMSVTLCAITVVFMLCQVSAILGGMLMIAVGFLCLNEEMDSGESWCTDRGQITGLIIGGVSVILCCCLCCCCVLFNHSRYSDSDQYEPFHPIE
jgi:hypothetical protein